MTVTRNMQFVYWRRRLGALAILVTLVTLAILPFRASNASSTLQTTNYQGSYEEEWEPRSPEMVRELILAPNGILATVLRELSSTISEPEPVVLTVEPLEDVVITEVPPEPTESVEQELADESEIEAEPLAAAEPISDVSSGELPTEDIWAELRQCESENDYNKNTGNDYYGAYQFLLTTWQELGYGGYPHEASPGVQDQAARELQDRDGWGPWPECSVYLGLV